MRINIFYGFMLIIAPLTFVRGQNFDIKTQCMDADDRTMHDINPNVSWSLEGACKRKYCKEVRDENNYNAKFAIVIESGCQPIPSPPYDPPYDIKNCKEYDKICETAPIEKVSKKKFPDCCPRHICICGSKIWQWATNDKGALSIKKQQTITQLIRTNTDQGSTSGDASGSSTSGDTTGNSTSGDEPGSSTSGDTSGGSTFGDAPGRSSSGDTPGNSTPGDAPRNSTSGGVGNVQSVPSAGNSSNNETTEE